MKTKKEKHQAKLVPLEAEKKALEIGKKEPEDRLITETDPKRRESTIKQIKLVDQEIQTVDNTIGETKTKISDVEQEIKTTEDQIIEEEKKIQELIDICENPIATNPYFLRSQLIQLKEEKKQQQNQTSDKMIKQQLQLEIERLEAQANGVLVANNRKDPCLDTSKINPSVLKEQLLEGKKEKIAKLEQNQNSEEAPLLKPEEIAQLEADIARIEEQTERLDAILQTATIDLIVNTKTIVLFYANFEGETPQALFFEWDLGDGRKKTGQNARFTYPDPGTYEIRLSVSGALTSLSDFITIKVIEIE